jgi:uncharacterized protein (DUF488 family)
MTATFVAGTVYTVGHSTRSAAALVDLLAEADVNRVIDVRRYPASRRHPHFDAEALGATLAEAGIGYRHCADLGGRRSGRPIDASPNLGWREAGFRGYADYALSPPFRDALAELIDDAARHRPAILCAEAVWWRCHRRIIADYLLSAGVPVVHLLGPGRRDPARLTPGAIRQPDGTLFYPPAHVNLL